MSSGGKLKEWMDTQSRFEKGVVTKMLNYTGLMVLVPISSYFITEYLTETFSLSASPAIVAAIVAVVSVQFILISFIYDAIDSEAKYRTEMSEKEQKKAK
eukprot:Clim_evm49s109 gene=Clim_evmTU49s109